MCVRYYGGYSIISTYKHFKPIYQYIYIYIYISITSTTPKQWIDVDGMIAHIIQERGISNDNNQ